MAIWTAFLSVWGYDSIEFQVELPDEYTEQDVYDAIYADMWLDLTKED
jgi:hypothetical protein